MRFFFFPVLSFSFPGKVNGNRTSIIGVSHYNLGDRISFSVSYRDHRIVVDISVANSILM